MPEGLSANGVATRRDLEEYLGQALLDEYYFREEGRIVRQVSTFLKTYIIEVHPGRESVSGVLTRAGFGRVEETQEPTLLRVIDGRGRAFFVDSLNERFPLIHTIELADASDAAVRRLVSKGLNLDHCWLPSLMLMNEELGQAIGVTADLLSAEDPAAFHTVELLIQFVSERIAAQAA